MRTPLVLLGTAAFVLQATAAVPEKVTFEDHVLPILQNACNNCHNPDKKKAGLDLTTYGGALLGSDGGKVVLPGDAAASLLLKCVKGTEEPVMPPKGDRLNANDIAVLERWIATRALESLTSKGAPVANNVAAAAVSLTRPSGPPPMPGKLPTGPVVDTPHSNALIALAASPWSPLMAVGGQKQVLLYHADTLELLGVLPFPEGLPTILRFSRNGELLLAGGGVGAKSGKVALWKITNGERIATLGNEVDQVLAADLSPDQTTVILGGPNRLLKFFSTTDGKLIRTVKKHTDWVTALAYSADGAYVASADRAGGITVWESATGAEAITLPGHKTAVNALAFLPGLLVSAGQDGTVVLWFNSPTGVAVDGSGNIYVADFMGCVIRRITSSGEVLSGDTVMAGDWNGKVQAFLLADGGKPFGEVRLAPAAK
ncbi:MAG: hypothetical protein EBR81_05520 [Proteobacteria bacterium]|nr:hypothetical protein [Pseudomonadota bacterium]